MTSGEQQQIKIIGGSCHSFSFFFYRMLVQAHYRINTLFRLGIAGM
jgi:hypothetical protein